ncbi:MAG: hypothetical protein ACR2OA_03615 [Rubripirellula sp.]
MPQFIRGKFNASNLSIGAGLTHGRNRRQSTTMTQQSGKSKLTYRAQIPESNAAHDALAGNQYRPNQNLSAFTADSSDVLNEYLRVYVGWTPPDGSHDDTRNGADTTSSVTTRAQTLSLLQ